MKEIVITFIKKHWKLLAIACGIVFFVALIIWFFLADDSQIPSYEDDVQVKEQAKVSSDKDSSNTNESLRTPLAIKDSAKAAPANPQTNTQQEHVEIHRDSGDDLDGNNDVDEPTHYDQSFNDWFDGLGDNDSVPYEDQKNPTNVSFDFDSPRNDGIHNQKAAVKKDDTAAGKVYTASDGGSDNKSHNYESEQDGNRAPANDSSKKYHTFSHEVPEADQNQSPVEYKESAPQVEHDQQPVAKKIPHNNKALDKLILDLRGEFRKQINEGLKARVNDTL